MDVQMFPVGPVQENCFLIRLDGAAHAVIVDPGEEAPRLLDAIESQGLILDAILLTHTPFDHVGAVAPIARKTGAPLYCPQLQVPALPDVMAYGPWPGRGPVAAGGKVGRRASGSVVPHSRGPLDGAHSARPGGNLAIVVMTSRNSGHAARL